MKRRIALGLGAVMAMSAAPAAVMACTPGGNNVLGSNDATICVTVNVAQIVDVWSDDAALSLTMSGANAENSDAVASSIKYISNTDSNIVVSVDDTAGDPYPGDDFNFFIFPNQSDPAAALSAIVTNANAPAGGLRWRGADMDTARDFSMGNVASPSITTIPLVYAVSAPNVMPDVATVELSVVYTISPVL